MNVREGEGVTHWKRLAGYFTRASSPSPHVYGLPVYRSAHVGHTLGDRDILLVFFEGKHFFICFFRGENVVFLVYFCQWEFIFVRNTCVCGSLVRSCMKL